jgi:phage tail sheath gpL-like
MATYGSFPGVEVETKQGGIQSVSVGLEEKVIIFGEANYNGNGNVDGDASAGELVNIAAPTEADTFFGEGSEVGDAMNEAISNGANIDFLRAMAVPQTEVIDETAGT